MTAGKRYICAKKDCKQGLAEAAGLAGGFIQVGAVSPHGGRNDGAKLTDGSVLSICSDFSLIPVGLKEPHKVGRSRFVVRSCEVVGRQAASSCRGNKCGLSGDDAAGQSQPLGGQRGCSSGPGCGLH